MYIDYKKKGVIQSIMILFIILISFFISIEILKYKAGTSINPLSVVISESMSPNIEKGDIVYIEYKNPL